MGKLIVLSLDESEKGIYDTIELDEKFCDVIVKRFIEQAGTTENVYVVRDSQTIKFDELEVGVDGK